MTSLNREPSLSPALTTLTELVRSRISEATRSDLDRELGQLHAKLARGRVRRKAMVRWSFVFAGLITTALLVASAASLHRRELVTPLPQLSYQIDGGRILDGGYLRELGQAGISLRFNEGSLLEFASGARGRVRSLSREGARIAVDSGTASFRITPNPKRHWSIESGPFLVAVKGTAFDVTWDPVLERFELKLREGRVTVEGPVSGGSLSLHQGQRLVVNLARSETVITDGQFETGVASNDASDDDASSKSEFAPIGRSERPPAQLPSLPSLSSAREKPESVAAKVAEPRSWAQELARGNWDHILSEVSRVGVDVALNRASSEDLFALADAARYRRQSDLARLALLAQRRRFPSSPRATEALYMLGRVDESRGATARALEWYDDYLKRAPVGAFAAEALGRKMIIAKSGHGTDSPRLIAEAYLRQFPGGSYAGTARAILHAQ